MTAAPIQAAALAPALRPLGQATMLPAAAYTSRSVFDWERRHMFAGSWACAGHIDELRLDADGSPISQRGLMVGDVPVVLAFPSEGVVRALANTCRHRGHEIVGDGRTATRRTLQCPYHAWTYSLDGALVRAPGLPDLQGVELAPLPVEVWHGWVFVNAVATAMPFAQHIGALDTLVAPYEPERLIGLARHDYEIAANWKIIVENYHECYHCPLIHPELCQVSPPTSGANYDLPGAWVGGSMQLREHAATMSLDGRSGGRLIEGVDPRVVLYLGLFPNLLLSLHPDYVMAHRLSPLAPDRTLIECSWYFTGEDIDPSYAVEFWDRTNRQDWAACESVQCGLTSPHFVPGPFAPNEDAVHQWVSMIARIYRGDPPGHSYA